MTEPIILKSQYETELTIQPYLVDDVPGDRICIGMDSKLPDYSAAELAAALDGIVPGFRAFFDSPLKPLTTLTKPELLALIYRDAEVGTPLWDNHRLTPAGAAYLKEWHEHEDEEDDQ